VAATAGGAAVGATKGRASTLASRRASEQAAAKHKTRNGSICEVRCGNKHDFTRGCGPAAGSKSRRQKRLDMKSAAGVPWGAMDGARAGAARLTRLCPCSCFAPALRLRLQAFPGDPLFATGGHGPCVLPLGASRQSSDRLWLLGRAAGLHARDAGPVVVDGACRAKWLLRQVLVEKRENILRREAAVGCYGSMDGSRFGRGAS